jgi:two-component system, LytTR family, sensor kinase
MNYRLRLHILFWLAYLLFESYVEFAWISASFQSIPVVPRFLMALSEETVQLVLKIPFTYLIFFLIYSVAARAKSMILPVVAGIVSLAVALVLHRSIIVFIILPYIYKEDGGRELLFNTPRMISSFIDIIFMIGMAIVAKQYRLHQQWKEREKALVKERLEAELKFLRTQTNPHFLFNTLNNIYALARKKSDDTADVVMKLSKLLRFMLYESKKDSITISEELRVLADYIELEKIRYNDRLRVRFNRLVDREDTLIAPLILLPFVENAFKHGASEARFDSYITIDVVVEKGQLDFTIKNSKDDDGETAIEENIGLGNVRRQLELMYPDHQLALHNGNDSFTVQLSINLNKHATV